MSTQLRLVENLPETADAAARPARGAQQLRGRVTTPSTRRRARATGAGRARRARWDTDWRLDAQSRSIGRQGVAAARAALERSAGTRLPAA